MLHLESIQPIIERAYQWLCKAHSHRGISSDCWHVRHHKNELLPELCESLVRMDYQFSPRTQYRMPNETLSLYSSQDSLILKAMSLILSDILKSSLLLSPHCYHLKGNGGLKKAVNHTKENLQSYRFVFKSDIKGYYEHINHRVLHEDLVSLIEDNPLTSLIMQSLKVPSTWGGLYYDHDKGLPKGSPLSPLLGGIALHRLDCAMTQIKGVFYARFMDDWVVLCKTRHQLKKVIRRTYQILDELQLTLHPDKTYIGTIEKGFDFLGYHFSPKQLTLAKVTLDKAIAKLRQLFEQGAGLPRLCMYWRRFIQWAYASCEPDLPLELRSDGFLKRILTIL
ncbi:reverse transcriptase/maturase family protein [Legionella yabuuchiae]|uniref:reverse transcriptase/maturase family protein n=1 Tax=Legionella yabuuchiae TaxID=376727 RepID=UPI0010566C85|nr:reverse transcriptase/maturase family protein [Legionella yabuuchiae]